MKQVFELPVMELAVMAIASLSVAGDKRKDKVWGKDRIEQSYHRNKDKLDHKLPSGTPFEHLVIMVEALEKRVAAPEKEKAELEARLARIHALCERFDYSTIGETVFRNRRLKLGAFRQRSRGKTGWVVLPWSAVRHACSVCATTSAA